MLHLACSSSSYNVQFCESCNTADCWRQNTTTSVCLHHHTNTIVYMYVGTQTASSPLVCITLHECMLVRKQFDNACKQQWCIKSDQVLNLYIRTCLNITTLCYIKTIVQMVGKPITVCTVGVCEGPAPYSCNLWLLHSHWRWAAVVIHPLLPTHPQSLRSSCRAMQQHSQFQTHI